MLEKIFFIMFTFLEHLFGDSLISVGKKLKISIGSSAHLGLGRSKYPTIPS